VDISGSMAERDFVIDGQEMNRLEAVKRVAGEFIERRVGDRIGLILFGDAPYVQTPLTFDRSTARHMLNEAEVGIAGKATALGDAIGLAIKRLKDRPQQSRVLVLLTDGRHTAGNVRPFEAAQVAAREGVRIHTIGVGSAPGDGRGLFSALMRGSSDLDEPALRQISRETDGRYFRARDTEELARIYAAIDELEPLPGEAEVFRPQRELFHWPLAAALLLSVPLAWRLLRGRG
jgi:Ca-activated chloride channel family protein